MKHACSLVLLATLATVGRAQTQVLNQPPAGVLVSAPVRDGVVQYDLTEPFTLTIVVEGGMQLDAEAPDQITKTPGWTLLTVNQPSKEKLTDTAVRWEREYVLDPLLPVGRHELQLVPLRYRDGADGWQVVTWPPLLIDVVAPTKLTTAADLRDITSIEELPPSTAILARLLWFMVAVAGVLLLAALCTLLWRRRRALSRLSAAACAEHELRRIHALNLPARGAVARYHTLLAHVLRGYLERRYGIPARRKTTEELRLEIEQHAELTHEQKADVIRFLEVCDLARFAGQAATEAECAERWQWELAFVTGPAAGDGPVQ